MSDAPEAGGSSAMRRSLRRCDGATGCPCVPDASATEDDASVDSSNHCATTELVAEEDASVDSSNHCATTELVAEEDASVDSSSHSATSTQPLSDSQDNSDSTVRLSSETSLTEALQRSIEVNDTAVLQLRQAERICRDYKRQVMVAKVEKSNLMFLVYCLVGVIISLVAAMVLRTN